MKQITQLGATTEEAISLALQQLKTTRDQVDVEVLQEGKKGFLGFGARQAEIRVTLKEVQAQEVVSTDAAKVKKIENQLQVEDSLFEKEEAKVEAKSLQEEKELFSKEEVLHVDPIKLANDYLNDIAKEMGIDDLSIQVESRGKNILFKLESEKAALLIGKRGATLNALQQLTQLIVNKSAKSFLVVNLDVENYRERRQEALEQLAKRMADKAIYSGSKVSLEPMPSYERKVIHNALANRVDIETYSQGTEPNRHLVIEPIK